MSRDSHCPEQDSNLCTPMRKHGFEVLSKYELEPESEFSEFGKFPALSDIDVYLRSLLNVRFGCT